MRWCPLVAVVIPIALAGCASLRLTPLRSVEQRPSEVAVFFDARTAAGDPIAGLKAEDFRVYEDGHLVQPEVGRQTIVSAQSATARYTLLLVDMSARAAAGRQDDTIPEAVSAFAVRVASQQRVAIEAFDGSAAPFPVVPFAEQSWSARAGARELGAFRSKDPSANLNGAVTRALDDLQAALAAAPQPVKIGTLVVFATGPDRAHRVTDDEMRRRVRETPFDVFAIGAGPAMEAMEPWAFAQIGKSGTVRATGDDTLLKAFDDAGVLVEEHSKSVYGLAYCSPSRAGKHDVRLELAVKDAATGREQTGSVRSSFDATDFAAGCDPSVPLSLGLPPGGEAPRPLVAVGSQGKRKPPKARPARARSTKHTAAKQDDFAP